MRAEIEYNFKDRPNAWTIERLSSNREGNDRCTGLPNLLASAHNGRGEGVAFVSGRMILRPQNFSLAASRAEKEIVRITTDLAHRRVYGGRLSGSQLSRGFNPCPADFLH
jgi:hypothetical protein